MLVVTYSSIDSDYSSLPLHSLIQTTGISSTFVVLELIAAASFLWAPINSPATIIGPGIVFIMYLLLVYMSPVLGGLSPILQLDLIIMPVPHFTNQKVPYSC